MLATVTMFLSLCLGQKAPQIEIRGYINPHHPGESVTICLERPGGKAECKLAEPNGEWHFQLTYGPGVHAVYVVSGWPAYFELPVEGLRVMGPLKVDQP